MLVIVGKSGSGKSTLVDEMVKAGYEKIVTYTTRPMREGEMQDRDYHFISEKEFEDMKWNNLFAETTSYEASFGHCDYGSLKEDYDDPEDKKVIILNPYGLKEIQNLGIKHTSVFLDVDPGTLRNRLNSRGDTKEEIKRRLDADERDFAGIKTDITVSANGLSPADIREMIEMAMGKDDIELDY